MAIPRQRRKLARGPNAGIGWTEMAVTGMPWRLPGGSLTYQFRKQTGLTQDLAQFG